ncbi:MAG TPA: hypothetical protein VF223_00955 [Trebonia sp.]
MRWFKRWYGANPLHLLAMIGCFALAWYAGAGLLHAKPVGVVVWFAGAVIGHDLILMPLYALADKSVMTVFRHRPPKLPTVPWINYLRVPVVLSGLLLLLWFPLIFRIPSHFPRSTDLSLDPYLGHWLLVTGALFLLSAVVFAVRLRPGRQQPAPSWAEPPDPPVRRPVAYGNVAYDNPFAPPQRPREAPDWGSRGSPAGQPRSPAPGRHRRWQQDDRQWPGSQPPRQGNRRQWPEDARRWPGDARQWARGDRQWPEGRQWQQADRQWPGDR